MRLRTVISIGLVISVSTLVIATASLKGRSKQTAKQAGGLRIPTITDQLTAENGVIPVELRCEDAELSAPNALEKLSCVIKNNTTKYIAAATINISLHTEREGKQSLDSSYLTIDRHAGVCDADNSSTGSARLRVYYTDCNDASRCSFRLKRRWQTG